MKALLLAAGHGERLRPWTSNKPKCMVEVAGRPVIDWLIDWLTLEGVSSYVINLHHCPDVIPDYLGDGRARGISISYSHEQSLRGTAGAIAEASTLLGPDPFLVIYADNVIRLNLKHVIDLHSRAQAIMTVALHWREDVSSSGVAETDSDGYISQFVEKPGPGSTTSRWVNAGLMVCDSSVLHHIPYGSTSDIGRDLLPAILAANQRVAAYKMRSPDLLAWIDTPTDLIRTAGQLSAVGVQ